MWLRSPSSRRVPWMPYFFSTHSLSFVSVSPNLTVSARQCNLLLQMVHRFSQNGFLCATPLELSTLSCDFSRWGPSFLFLSCCTEGSLLPSTVSEHAAHLMDFLCAFSALCFASFCSSVYNSLPSANARSGLLFLFSFL